ncbi:hypothetical protein [Streptomyces sp. LaBMicrA B280]|uniref:hypothetical protein n=1 Tax=Streptomyces sp. LaBMicrA B280 TaxID=3391001 RepID=UPI003BA55AC4
MAESEGITGCVDPDPRVRLAQMADRASVLVELDRLTEQIAMRLNGEMYSGPSALTVERQEAAETLSKLAGLHEDDDLSDQAVVDDLHESLAVATELIKILQVTTDPAAG